MGRSEPQTSNHQQPGTKAGSHEREEVPADQIQHLVTHPASRDRLTLHDQAIFLAAGETHQWLHRDADNWSRINRPDGPELTVSCMIAIDDFTEDNGATRVVPGSHTWPDFARRPDPSDLTVQALMPAGSGLIYTGRAIHGGGENRSSTWRRGLHISFVVGWLTPEEAVPLGVSWATVRNEPVRVQQLLGWRSTTLNEGGGRLWTVDYDDVPVGLGLT